MAISYKYIVKNDYLTVIQYDNFFQQVLGGAGDIQRFTAEAWAISVVESKLAQKFDLGFEITDTLPFDNSKTYYAGDRCTIDFSAWVSGRSYAIGDCVILNEIGYYCTYANNNTVFDPNNWNAIGNQYDIYYIQFPYPIFSLNPQLSRGTYTAGVYKIGDHTIWENKIYRCKQPTLGMSHAGYIQYQQTSDIPAPNIFPNAENNWQWEFVEDFNIEQEPPYRGSNIWTYGDNRDVMLVQAILDLSIWRLHSRISPNNIPELREKAKNSAFEWLNACNAGKINVNIQLLQPLQGSSLSWGSSPKLINKY